VELADKDTSPCISNKFLAGPGDVKTTRVLLLETSGKPAIKYATQHTLICPPAMIFRARSSVVHGNVRDRSSANGRLSRAAVLTNIRSPRLATGLLGFIECNV